jgi:hypothetical protein
MPNPEKKRKKWNPQVMQLAVNAVKENKMGFLKASKVYGVPRSTLENYGNNKNKDVDKLNSTKLGRKSVLDEELEKEFVYYCRTMEDRFVDFVLS